MPNQIPTSFSVQIAGNLSPYPLNPSMTLARVSVFHEYGNDNGSYFTQEVARQMVEGAIGTPIIGCYSSELQDFTSHLTIADTRAYGFVPPDPEFAWEARQENGKSYNYACFNVVLWTNRYEEASKIIGKSQSMELDPKTVTGSWQEIEGGTYFVYDHAEIYGLCVLGDNVAPCFDNACFFNKDDNFRSYIDAIKAEIKNNFSLMAPPRGNEGGQQDVEYKVNMPEGLFSQLFEALNPDVVDDVRAVNKMVCSYSADSMLVYDAQDQKHYSIAFSVNTDEAGVSTVALGESVEVSVLTLDGNAQNEYNALFTEGNTYASVKEQLDNYAETVANQEATINDFNEKDYPGQIETLNSKLATYEAAEAERINAAKDALINEYSESVDPEVIQDVTDHKDNFSYEEIEAKLAVNFSRKMRSSGGKIPSAHDEPSDPTLNVLNKYMNSKRGNK